jgi:hypothetical protein
LSILRRERSSAAMGSFFRQSDMKKPVETGLSPSMRSRRPSLNYELIKYALSPICQQD